MISKHFWIPAFIFLTCFSACQVIRPAVQIAGKWQMDDLRLLEAPTTPDPAFDLIAAYTRQVNNDIELRFDLLGSPELKAYDIYLAIDIEAEKHNPEAFPIASTIDWDYLLIYPAKGIPQAIRSDGNPAAIRPRSVRSSVSDSFSARINKTALNGAWEKAQFQAMITRPGSLVVEDKIGPFSYQTPGLDQQAALALIFWDALPAATPAQALRRWDGAHTGPFGQRHGLKILLEAARETKTPVAVLDLQQPERLAALEALGGLKLVRDLQAENLLILPDMGFGDALSARNSLQVNTRAAQAYKLQRTNFFYGTAPDDLSGKYPAVFGRLGNATQIRKWNNTRIIPLPQP
ncbi:MAG: hypothetical protein IH586_04940, partial [Anaerolineaceae bacterium]|nr:hypothetical protein [Anaerolineaceae bacterium]